MVFHLYKSVLVFLFVIFRTFAERLAGETRPYSGHFDIVKPDGTVIPVNSADMNCFYHAVVQATSCSTVDHKQRAVQLRNEMKDLVSIMTFKTLTKHKVC